MRVWKLTGGRTGERSMAKRKRPEGHTGDQYAGKEEDNVVSKGEDTLVLVGEAPKGGLVVD